MDEKHILARARKGDIEAFEQLVTMYERRVYSAALRSSMSPEDAADITQEVFLKAWRSIESFRGDSGFSTWLFRITVNMCVDYARKRQSHPKTERLEAEDEMSRQIIDKGPTPEEHLDNSELGRELTEALNEISEDHRQIVLLRDVSGLSYTEIADVLKISEGTVKSRLSRARLALRDVLLKRGNILRVPASKSMEGGGDA